MRYSVDAALTIPAPVQLKRLNPFERYLSVWVALCIAVGVGQVSSFPNWCRTSVRLNLEKAAILICPSPC